LLAYVTTYSFLYAAVFALAAFALVQLGLSLLAIRRSAAGARPPTESQPESATPWPAPEETEVPQQENRDAQRFGGGAIVQGDPSDAVRRLNAENEVLESRGLPMEMVAERHIRYHASPIRLMDLLDVAGENSAISGFTFEHCILEGPGIITFRGPPPGIETQRGVTATGMVGPTNCRVEGAPDTTLYEINPDGIKRLHGVIQLVGPTIRNVTFRNLGFAGTPDELRQLRQQFTFSDGGSATEDPVVAEPELPEGAIGELTVKRWTDTHPWIKEGEMDGDSIRQRSIHIADFARRVRVGGRAGVVLKEKVFDNCHIYGPTILVPLDTGEVGGKAFVRCQRLDQEDTFWLPADHPSEHAGTVKLEDCLFRDCIFTEVGVVGSPERDGEVKKYQANG
jgi:hypothetical protein